MPVPPDASVCVYILSLFPIAGFHGSSLLILYWKLYRPNRSWQGAAGKGGRPRVGNICLSFLSSWIVGFFFCCIISHVCRCQIAWTSPFTSGVCLLCFLSVLFFSWLSSIIVTSINAASLLHLHLSLHMSQSLSFYASNSLIPVFLAVPIHWIVRSFIHRFIVRSSVVSAFLCCGMVPRQAQDGVERSLQVLL